MPEDLTRTVFLQFMRRLKECVEKKLKSANSSLLPLDFVSVGKYTAKPNGQLFRCGLFVPRDRPHWLAHYCHIEASQQVNSSFMWVSLSYDVSGGIHSVNSTYKFEPRFKELEADKLNNGFRLDTPCPFDPNCNSISKVGRVSNLTAGTVENTEVASVCADIDWLFKNLGPLV